MKLFTTTIFILFFVLHSVQSQSLTLLKGKVTSQLKELKTVTISNLRSKSNTSTDGNLNFSMFVKVGDTLEFSGLQVITKIIIIDEIEIAKKLLVCNLESKIILLDEVEIKKYPSINAVSLGILQTPAKVYTPAEKKLKAAKEFNVGYYKIPLPNIFFSVDPIINAISGRTALLKKELQVERKEHLLEKIEYLFKEDFFTENLKIPKEYIRGFWYYAIEEPKLIEALNTKNKITSRFIFADLSFKYLETVHK